MRLLAVGGGRQFLFFASPLDVLRIFSPLTPAFYETASGVCNLRRTRALSVFSESASGDLGVVILNLSARPPRERGCGVCVDEGDTHARSS
jgi:hypothetical protein